MANFSGSIRPGMPVALEVAAARSRAEIDVHDLEVDGEIPAQLDGAFFRMASDRQYPSRFPQDDWFNEDGMITSFRFKNGRIDLKHRYVQTARWKAERAAGRSLFGLYRNPFTDDPSVQGIERWMANTAPIVHAGKLLAMKEDGMPHAIDPKTLETLGPWDFHGTMKNPTFTAHARIDPKNGHMIAFGYAGKGLFSRDVVYFDINREGRVQRSVEFEVPYYNMMHDIGVSQRFVVWPIVPLVGAGEDGLKKGYKHFGWDPSLPMYLAVMPREGDAKDIRWFVGPTQFVSHLMNTFDDASGVHMDGSRADGNCFPFFPEFGKPFDFSKMNPRLTRYTAQYEKGGKTPQTATPFETTVLSDYISEFPRHDDRYQTLPYRHGWELSYAGTRNSFAHVDLATGKTTLYETPVEDPCQEPCFIPRTPDSPEGDGYIIALVTRTKEHRTDALLFEATHIDRGPIATIKLPVRLRSGWHGYWANASTCAM